MFLTGLLLVVGAGLTLWAARVWYVSDSQPPSYIQPRDLPHYRPGWWRKWRGVLITSLVGGSATLYFCGALWFGHYHNEHWVTCRIDRLENLGKNQYRIQSSDCGVLNNVNAWPRMKANAPSLQGQLEKAVTAELRVAGARILGWYPNVVAIRGVTK